MKVVLCDVLILPVLILVATVVGMEDEISLSKAIVLKVVVEQRDDTVGPLPCAHPFIDQVVDLR